MMSETSAQRIAPHGAPSNPQASTTAAHGGLAGSAVTDAGLHTAKPKAGSLAKRTRERLVLISIALTTAAVAAVLYAQFDFSLSAAVLSGGIAWAGLMSLHMHVKKTAEIAALKAELIKLDAQSATAYVASAANSLEAARPVAAKSETAKAAASSSRRTASSSASSAPAAAQPLVAAGNSTAQTKANDNTVAAPSGPQPQPRWEMSQAQPRSAADPSRRAPAAVETALWPGTALSASDPMRDQWAFRPKDVELTVALQMDADGELPGIDSLPLNLNSDLEMVQRKIKAMADEVNAAEGMRDRPSSVAQGTPGASAMEKSIGALKATAETMRVQPQAPLQKKPAPAEAMTTGAPRDEVAFQPLNTKTSDSPSMHSLPFDLLIPATAERIAVSTPVTAAVISAPASLASSLAAAGLPDLSVFEFTLPPPPVAPNPRLAVIVAAVESGSMDVFLSPIVALQSHQVSHYDVTVRLKSAAGSYIDDAEQELQLAGSDMLALFDTARLKRSAALAQRLDAHNKSGSLLSAVNAKSITSEAFLEAFARVYEERERISNQLVLTFTQEDVEQFTASAWQALSDMHAFGFRFALSKIEHVGMDFSALAKLGFAFLRLDANALINGLPARERFVGPDDLCKLLAGAGMTLVADTIDDEAIRARVFGFGVLFGQGRLFGGARQVKLDALPAGSSAAA
jgi:cyclic-di-GMP phosphodiesterase, flagellum assembly factor TipF